MFVKKRMTTPYYEYDFGALNQVLGQLKLAVTYRSNRLLYPIGSCADQKVLSQIAIAGFSAACVNESELALALQCGFEPQNIVFKVKTGHGSDLQQLIDEGVGLFGCTGGEKEPEKLGFTSAVKPLCEVSVESAIDMLRSQGSYLWVKNAFDLTLRAKLSSEELNVLCEQSKVYFDCGDLIVQAISRLVTCVVDVNIKGDKPTVVVDADAIQVGLNLRSKVSNIAYNGIAFKRGQRAYDVVGAAKVSYLGRNVVLPQVKPGDLLTIDQRDLISLG